MRPPLRRRIVIAAAHRRCRHHPVSQAMTTADPSKPTISRLVAQLRGSSRVGQASALKTLGTLAAVVDNRAAIREAAGIMPALVAGWATAVPPFKRAQPGCSASWPVTAQRAERRRWRQARCSGWWRC